MATWPTQSEVPPSNTVVQIPHLIQPAAVLQTLPGFPSVGVCGEDSFESPAALPAMPSGSEARTSFPWSESQSAPPSSSAPKLMLPSLGPSKFRKPYVRRKPTRRKGAKASPCVKPAPIIHPTPVIFTVPATTVKVVSLGGGCNMIQPVTAAVAPSPQTIPITTLLVNPTSFPCSLNQPLVASSISPLLVSSNPLALPVTSLPEEKAHVSLDIAEGKNAPQNPEPKIKPQEPTPQCATVFSKEEPRSWHPSADTGNQEAVSESSACSWAAVKTEGQEGSSEKSVCGWTEKASSVSEMSKQTATPREETQAAKSPSVSQDAPDAIRDASKGLPQSTLSSMDQGTVLNSPPGKPEDSANADGQSVGTPAGTDTGAEKDGAEEEEEEDFDDLTQDEEDELSSASEESVLSVPELQETMEKLTWLASERRMSQEGESEEENSQEENSEPEEEEEEEAEGMETLQKEDEATDEAGGGAAEKPPSTLASPHTAPEVETSITPAAQAVSEVLGHLSSFLALDSFLSCRTHAVPGE
ncbi:rCG62619 [Rattus norvegicus]|uniref:RCG62619 n=1 Tax=Rattus norvegicus TaxID=10116 RepID=A6J6A8_RAT|nr:rCG62619 [Rattus norvegicus]